jgi:hypothetical protein
MSLSTKILLILGSLLIIGTLSFIVYNQHQIAAQQTAIQTQIVAQQQLVDGLVRSQSQYATAAGLAQFASDNNINLKAIQDNLDTLNSKISAINVATADSVAQTVNNLPSTSTGPSNPNPTKPTTVSCPNGGSVTCPTGDPFGFMSKEQLLTLNEDFANPVTTVPFGSVGFSAWQQNPWNISIAAREYNVDTVVGTDQNQRQTFYNKFTVNVNNQTYTIPIKTATTKQVLPTATFTLFNPRLLLGADGGVNVNHIQGEFAPSISVGIMSYGQFLTTPDLSILEVGAAYQTVNKRPAVIITPVAYNIGRNFFSPLMNNTYVGPSVMMATDGSWTLGAGLKVGF